MYCKRKQNLLCCVRCCAGQTFNPERFCCGLLERVGRAAFRIKYGSLHPHLVEAAGLNDGEAGDVVLLETAGAGALLDHSVLKEARGGKQIKKVKQQQKAKNQENRASKNQRADRNMTRAQAWEEQILSDGNIGDQNNLMKTASHGYLSVHDAFLACAALITAEL